MNPYQLQLMQSLANSQLMNPGMFAPASQGVFDATAMQYQANSPTNYRPPSVSVSPLAPLNLGQFGPIGALADAAISPSLTSMMVQSGVTPMGNAVSPMQAARERQYQEMQQTVAANVAGNDAGGIYRTLRGFAALTGQPFNQEQREAARNLSSTIASSGSLLNMFAPDLLDAMAGPRGSIQGMAGQLMRANRYTLDPVTGRMGASAETNTALTQELFDQMYSGDNYQRMNGIRAGEAGQMFSELQARGLMGLGSVRDRQRAAILDVQGSGGLQEALSDAGISRQINDASELTNQEINKLAQTDAVQSKMTSADASRIKDRLQGYSASLAAMREVFGENGDPNAPIPKLIGALEGLTQGNIQKFDSNNLNTMVRDLQSMSQMSGLSVDQLALRQQGGVTALDAVMGAGNGVYFSPTSTNLAVSQGMGYGQLPGQQGFGALNREATEQSIQRQFARGMGSEANNTYAALSVIERTSGFDQNTEAGRRLAAINQAAKSGQSTYEFDGQTYKLPTRSRDIRGLIREGGARDMDAGDFNLLLSDRVTLEREMAENPELQTIALNNQYNEILDRQKNQVANRFIGSEALRNATPNMSVRDRERVSRSLSNASVEALQNLSLEEQQDPELRQAAMVAAIKQQAANENVQITDSQANVLANATFGESDSVARSAGFEGGNFELNQVLGRQATEQRNRNMQRIKSRSALNESMAKLGPTGSLKNRIFSGIQKQGERGADADLKQLFLDSFGADASQAEEKLRPHMEQIEAERQALEDLNSQLNSGSLTEAERKDIQNQMNTRQDKLDQHIAEVNTASEALGINESVNSFGRDDVETGRRASRSLQAFTTMDQARNLAMTSDVDSAALADFANQTITRDDALALARQKRQSELGRIQGLGAGDLKGEDLDKYNEYLANGVNPDAALRRVKQNMRRDVKAVDEFADDMDFEGLTFENLSPEQQATMIRNRRSAARMAPTDDEIDDRLNELKAQNVQGADRTLAEDSLVAENLLKSQGELGTDASLLDGGGDVRKKIEDANTLIRRKSAEQFKGTEEEAARQHASVASRLDSDEGRKLIEDTNNNIASMSDARRQLLSDDAAINRLGVSAAVQAVNESREAENNLQARANRYFGGDVGEMVAGGMGGMDEEAQKRLQEDLTEDRRKEVADYLGKDAADVDTADYLSFLNDQNQKDIATMGSTIDTLAGAMDYKKMASDFTGQLGFDVSEEDIKSIKELQRMSSKSVGDNAKQLGLTEDEYLSYMQGTASAAVTEKVDKAFLFSGDKKKLTAARSTRQDINEARSTIANVNQAEADLKPGETLGATLQKRRSEAQKRLAAAESIRDKQMQEAGYDPANPDDVTNFERALSTQGTVEDLQQRRKDYESERAKLREAGKTEAEIDQLLGTFEARQEEDRGELERLQKMELSGVTDLARGLGVSTEVGEEDKGLKTLQGLSSTDKANRNQRLVGSALSKIEGTDLEGDTSIEKLDFLTDEYAKGSEDDRKKLAKRAGMSVRELDRMMSQTEFLGLEGSDVDMSKLDAEGRAKFLSEALTEVKDRDIGKEQAEEEDKTMKIVGELILDSPLGKTKGSLANTTGSNGSR
jgi:hypothetical protein